MVLAKLIVPTPVMGPPDNPVPVAIFVTVPPEPVADPTLTQVDPGFGVAK